MAKGVVDGGHTRWFHATVRIAPIRPPWPDLQRDIDGHKGRLAGVLGCQGAGRVCQGRREAGKVLVASHKVCLTVHLGKMGIMYGVV